MIEIIPAQKVKVIPWSEREYLVVCKRTKEQILLVGLETYLRSLKKEKRRVAKTEGRDSEQ